MFGKKSSQEKASYVVQVKEDGSIVLPKEAMDMFGIVSGDNVAVLGEKSKGGLVIIKNDMMVKMLMKGQAN